MDIWLISQYGLIAEGLGRASNLATRGRLKAKEEAREASGSNVDGERSHGCYRLGAGHCDFACIKRSSRDKRYDPHDVVNKACDV